MRKTSLLTLFVLLISAQLASAQMLRFSGETVTFTIDEASLVQAAVQEPTAIQFTPSPDHSVTVTDLGVTTPVVTSYEMQVTKQGTSTVQKFDIGKPDPVDNTITYVWPASIRQTLGVGTFTLVLVSKGPGGASAGAPADVPFSQSPQAPAPAAPSGTRVIKP
jgi:hypothetical protein